VMVLAKDSATAMGLLCLRVHQYCYVYVLQVMCTLLVRTASDVYTLEVCDIVSVNSSAEVLLSGLCVHC
jgi:hypothetical protein